jgi:parallel beta-helix repeat protein
VTANYVYANHFSLEGSADSRFLYNVDVVGMVSKFFPVKPIKIMILIISPIPLGLMVMPYNIVEADKGDCIKYNASTNTIQISCKSVNLTDLYTSLDNPRILDKEPAGVWFLNANIRVNDRATFNINSSDTSWLKINSTSGTANNIGVRGNLLIDSVKISSWNSINNSYASTNGDGKTPRSYIKVEEGSPLPTKTDITNSEISHLGYNASKSFGLSYYAGANSVITNNKIHHLWYGFYSATSEVYNLLIEDNYFFSNYVYGIDPHSGTHNLIIRNNTVYDNGKHGIICSKYCDNITIDGNKVFDNMDRGIMLDKNVTNSTIADNMVYHNTAQIAIHTLSNNNKIDNNILYAGEIGIEISDNSSDNFVSNNIINDTRYGIYLLDAGQQNQIFANSVNNASDCSILVEDSSRSSSSNREVGDDNSSPTDTRFTDNPHCINVDVINMDVITIR